MRYGKHYGHGVVEGILTKANVGLKIDIFHEEVPVTGYFQLRNRSDGLTAIRSLFAWEKQAILLSEDTSKSSARPIPMILLGKGKDKRERCCTRSQAERNESIYGVGKKDDVLYVNKSWIRSLDGIFIMLFPASKEALTRSIIWYYFIQFVIANYITRISVPHRLLQRGFARLEPNAAKVASCALRRGRLSNALSLPDQSTPDKLIAWRLMRYSMGPLGKRKISHAKTVFCTE